MATISENLQTIKSSMSAIKQAISDKGGDVSGDISTWANTIETMEGGVSSGGAYPEINHGTSDTILSLEPNTLHIWDEVESLQLVYKRPTEGIANEYLFQFTSGATATTLYLPDTIKWVGGSAPTIQPNMIYQISILNDLGSVLEFSNTNTITFFVTKAAITYEFTCTKGMTWEEFVNSEYNNGTFAIYTQYNYKIRWSENFAYGVIGGTPTGVIEEGVTYDSKYGD